MKRVITYLLLDKCFLLLYSQRVKCSGYGSHTVGK